MNDKTVEILDQYAKGHWRQAVAGAHSVGLPYVCYEGGGFNSYTKPANVDTRPILDDPDWKIKDTPVK